MCLYCPRQDGKDYVPLGSFTNGKMLHTQAFKEIPFAVTNLRYENKGRKMIISKKQPREKRDSSSCSYMRSMATLQVFEELPCKEPDCLDVRHLYEGLKREERS